MPTIAKLIYVALGCGLLFSLPSGAQEDESVSDVPIEPGPETSASTEAKQENPYQGDQAAIQDGQRLFDWYNCSGCHAPKGGGGMGPPLSDDKWLYGGDPASIFNSIWEGRPQGMPAWAERIPEDEIWKIVAYIQTLPGEEPNWAPQEE